MLTLYQNLLIKITEFTALLRKISQQQVGFLQVIQICKIFQSDQILVERFVKVLWLKMEIFWFRRIIRSLSCVLRLFCREIRYSLKLLRKIWIFTQKRLAKFLVFQQKMFRKISGVLRKSLILAFFMVLVHIIFQVQLVLVFMRQKNILKNILTHISRFRILWIKPQRKLKMKAMLKHYLVEGDLRQI